MSIMSMYKLDPASYSYEEGRQYTESEIIWWAEDLAMMFEDESYDPTLIFDRNTYESMDIYRAIEVLERANEFVEPVNPIL